VNYKHPSERNTRNYCCTAAAAAGELNLAEEMAAALRQVAIGDMRKNTGPKFQTLPFAEYLNAASKLDVFGREKLLQARDSFNGPLAS